MLNIKPKLELLQELVNFVRVNPVPNLDLHTWKTTDDDHPCKTTHCILGWAGENKVCGLNIVPTGGHSRYKHHGLDVMKTMAYSKSEHFGITPQAFEWLFMSDSYDEGVDQDTVLDRIQSFIDWGHYEIVDDSNDKKYQLYQLEGFNPNLNLRDFYDQVQELPFSLAGMGYSVSTPELERSFHAGFLAQANRYCFCSGRNYLELHTFKGETFLDSYNLIWG